MTNQELTQLTEFHRTLSEKCARSGSNATLAFSEAANECERYRARHFLICKIAKMKDKTYFEVMPRVGRLYFRLKCYRCKSEPQKAVLPTLVFLSTTHFAFKGLQQPGFSIIVGWWDFCISFGVVAPRWIYGTCNNREARKHITRGNVQFVLFKKGEQANVDGVGHVEDKWVNFDKTWWPNFKVDMPEISN